jgi:hypothetical protein
LRVQNGEITIEDGSGRRVSLRASGLAE